jgi:chemotaxis protein CheX
MNTLIPQRIDEVSDLLVKSVGEVFGTMLNLTAQPAPLEDIRKSDAPMIAGSVGFIGEANGVVYIYYKASFARTLAARMLRIPEAELDADEMVDDVIGELTNMIVGSIKSRLCDAGAPCVLSIPSVVRGQNLRGGPTSACEFRLLTMQCEKDLILLELLMKPSK